MKRIVCYGDSNTWGFVPIAGETKRGESDRYPEGVRWTGVLAKLLGDEYRVIEEGLNGRTTAFNDVLGKYRNGAKYLGVCLATDQPVDLLIFMLGSNDTKKHIRASAAHIGSGLEKLIHIARGSDCGPDGAQPKILIISPVHIGEEVLTSWVRAEFDHHSIQKSHSLAGIFFDIARRNGCYYMNAAVYAKAGKADGLHFDAKNHKKLAEAIHTKVLEIFE